jgi:hypothetical protein
MAEFMGQRESLLLLKADIHWKLNLAAREIDSPNGVFPRSKYKWNRYNLPTKDLARNLIEIDGIEAGAVWPRSVTLGHVVEPLP